MIATMRHKTANVVAVAGDGVELFGVGVINEVFGSEGVNAYGVPGYDLTICSPGAQPVTTDTGLRLSGLAGLEVIASADLVLVPSMDPRLTPPQALLDALVDAHQRGARIASLCSGAFVLAAAGLLNGRRATAHWEDCPRLAADYPQVEVDAGVLYVDGGDILSSAGSSAAIDLCLHLVREDYGADIAARLARSLVTPPFRDGDQAQFVETPTVTVMDSDPFLEVIAWAQEHLREPITVAALATRAMMSKRSFARRFQATFGTSPYQWIQRQRIRLARQLLETSDLSVESIAESAGLGSAANLRARFLDDVHTTPSAYRRSFRGRARR
jgi:AraC family transcriptional regulator, transcriptional activator FtrA